MVYLDYAATTPIDPKVTEVIYKELQENFGNPASRYYYGIKAKNKLEQCRKIVSNILNVSTSSLIFLSNATEAINWALKFQAFKSRELGKGNHIVSTTVEHPAVEMTLRYLEKEGFKVTRIHPNENKVFSPELFIKHSNEKTIGWTAMYVNNEVGSILPVNEIGRIAKEKGYWFHVDSTQAIGYLDFRKEPLICTSFCGSGHKFYAPKGIGFLVYQPWNEKMELEPMILGGNQELGLRSGTENIPYIAGITKALQIITEKQDLLNRNFSILENYLFEQLKSKNIMHSRNGEIFFHNHRIHSIWLHDVNAMVFIDYLNKSHICISAGSACHSNTIEPSEVLKAYHPDSIKLYEETIRISFGQDTKFQDIDQFILITKEYLGGK